MTTSRAGRSVLLLGALGVLLALVVRRTGASPFRRPAGTGPRHRA